jgi:hypothetical protein
MAMQTETFETSDIALASYLFCSGTTLERIDRDNPKRCIFVFQLPKPELLSRWQEGKATVNALAFYNAYQNLKGKLYRGSA